MIISGESFRENGYSINEVAYAHETHHIKYSWIIRIFHIKNRKVGKFSTGSGIARVHTPIILQTG